MPWRAKAPNWCSQFLQETAEATWTAGADGVALAPAEWSALTGQTEEETRGEGWLDALHPDDVERAQTAWRNSVAHGSHYNTDYRIRCSDGVYRWFNARGAPIHDENGDLIQWVGVILAIPGMQRFDRKRSATARHLPSDFTDIMPGALRAARAMLGWSADRLADEAGISRSTIRRLESESDGVVSRRSNVAKVLSVLTAQGLLCTGSDGMILGVIAPDALAA